MELILRDGKLWKKKYNSEELVDVTSEGEKYLFHTTLDSSFATVKDFFKVLNSNIHLKEIFGVRATKEYETVVFPDERVKEILCGKGVVLEFLEYYKDKTDDQVNELIRNSRAQNSDYFELEIISDFDESGNYIDTNIDFVGVASDIRYSMSMASIDPYYFTPIKVKHYKSYYGDDGEQYLDETVGEIKTYEYFYRIASNLSEMTLEKDYKNQLV